jgi:Lrp/AsnC family leucine-responsive transcriptional regulator
VTAFVAARGATLSSAAWKRFRELMQSSEVLEVHTVAGDDCYLMKVRAGSIGGLNALVQQLSAAPLSLSTRTTIVMETHCEKVGGIDLGRRDS